MLKRMKIGHRLGIGFGLLLVLMVAMGLISGSQVRTLSGHADYFATNIVPSYADIHAVMMHVHKRRQLEYRHVASLSASELDQIEAELVKVDKDIDDGLALYFRQDISDDTDRVNTEAMAAAVKAYRGTWDAVRQVSRTALTDPMNIAKANEMMQADSQATFLRVEEAGKKWFSYMAQLSSAGAKEAQAADHFAVIALAVGTALSLAIGAAAAWLIARAIVVPLRTAVEGANRVADGDLTHRIESSSEDETGELLKALGRMQDALAHTVGSVRVNAETVATASTQIAQGNQDLSQRTEEQASALQQTAATMTQLGETVRHNADNARQADQLAKGASDAASRGGAVVSEVVSTMRAINDSSRKIADIIGTIDGIAFQTNILALNAAVEAARAGEQGRGFAVVAGEVRSLAQRSAEAAKEIKSLINSSVEQVEQGSALVDKAGTTMDEIVASISRVTDIVGEISSASSEQSRGVNQVGDAVTQMDQVTQQNAALVEESAAAAESLKQQAGRLVSAVASFKLAAQSRLAAAA